MNKQAVLMVITCLTDPQMETAVWSQMLPATLKISTELLTLQKQFKMFLFAKQNSQQINNLSPTSKYKKTQKAESELYCLLYFLFSSGTISAICLKIGLLHLLLFYFHEA